MVTIIILVVLLLGLGGYICYEKGLFKSLDKKTQPTDAIENKQNDDFYAINNLVQKKYLKKITNTGDEETKIKIVNGDVKIADYMEEKDVTVTGITGKAKYVYNLIPELSMCLSTYFVLTEDNQLYYAKDDSSDMENDVCKVPTTMTKVTDKNVTDIYAFNSYYPDEDNIYALMSDNTLVQVNANNGSLGKTFKENWPYPDFLKTVNDNTITGASSNRYTLGYLISSDKKLYYNETLKNTYTNNGPYNTDNSKELKYNGISVSIKDCFSSSTSENKENATMDAVYVIGQDNYLYKVNNNTSLERTSSVKVKTFKYEDNYCTITFADDTTTKYYVVNISTLSLHN